MRMLRMGRMDAMPSIITRYLRYQIRLLRPFASKLSIPAERIAQNKLGALGARASASKVTVTPVAIGPFESAFVSAKSPSVRTDRAILYLHGGGYVAGHLQYALAFGSILAIRMKRTVLCTAYRLAPEQPFPAAPEDALASYQHLLYLGYRPENISLVGESAGGGLIYCLCHLLRLKGLPLPAALVGISPWTDLTLSGPSYQSNKQRDPTLSEENLRHYAAAYAPGNERNPLASPLFGDLTAFPPSLLFVGGEELLLDDAVRLSERLKESGSACELVVEEGLWHVYPLYGIPEAKKALNKVYTFLERTS